jgi:hypothetical protein
MTTGAADPGNTAQRQPALPLGHRVRQAVNLVNGSTLAGRAVARAGSARPGPAPDGLLVAIGYQLPVPAAPAFTLGNVIITRHDSLDADSAVFRHEARHATQYAWCGGLLMLPLYFAGAGASWLLSGDFGAWNPFERGAGLADGGYTARPLRLAVFPVIARGQCDWWSVSGRGRTAAGRSGPGRGRVPTGPGGWTSTPCR